ncbi:hypothetical protein RJ53_05340 [Methanocalculus chunghsingensis]|uniref:Uncharacterized protein n=1 Tax=Methanocalculus chunghsingensis TaxID=156457 RepID=A0A8J7W9N5_9EURY|nr:hypothetical protein [Methanocalculus chunghsingensis]MBR1368957.1 hypothetical protein [Methanocalculus chunghsingensis]
MMRGIISCAILILLIPSAAGFVVLDSDGIPDGYLILGDEKTVLVNLGFPGLELLSFPSGDILELQTDLTNPEWTVILRRGGGESTLRQSVRSRERISGWELSYPAAEDVTLSISLRGTVPGNGSDAPLSIIRVRQLDGSYQLREDNEYSVSQIVSPSGIIPSGGIPDPVIIAPPPPDLSAFTISPRYTTPAGEVTPGETVTLRTRLSFDRLRSTSFPGTDTLRLRSALIDPAWEVTLIRNGAEMPSSTRRSPYYTIPGFELSYPQRENVGLRVAVTGGVPPDAGFPLLEISQCGPDGYAREGAIFIHPASIADLLEEPEEIPVIPPSPTPVPTTDTTPAHTPDPLPAPDDTGGIYPDLISFEKIGALIDSFIEFIVPHIHRIISGIGG